MGHRKQQQRQHQPAEDTTKCVIKKKTKKPKKKCKYSHILGTTVTDVQYYVEHITHIHIILSSDLTFLCKSFNKLLEKKLNFGITFCELLKFWDIPQLVKFHEKVYGNFHHF